MSEVLKLFIASVHDVNADVQQNSFRGINIIIEKANLTEDEKKLISEFLITNSNHIIDDIRITVFLGINLSIEKKLLSSENIERVLGLLIEGTHSDWLDVKKNSVFIIGTLIQSGKLPAEKVDQISKLLTRETNHDDNDVRKYALLGIVYLIEKKILPPLNLVEVLYLLKASKKVADNTNNRHKTLVAIKNIVEWNDIPKDKMKNIVNLLLEKKEITDTTEEHEMKKMTVLDTYNSLLLAQAESIDNITALTAVRQLTHLISQDKVPVEKLDELLTLFIGKTNHRDVAIMVNAISGIHQLIEKSKEHNERQPGAHINNYRLSEEQIIEIIDLFISISNDVDSNKRNSALLGINLLIKNKLLSIRNTEKVADYFLASTQSTWVDVRRNALLSLRELIKRKLLPAEKTEETIDLFKVNAKDRELQIRQISLSGIIALIESDIFPISKTEGVLLFLAERARVESCKHSEHKALVAIKKIVEQEHNLKNSHENILNLFIEKREKNDFYFEGITEVEKEEIMIIVDGSIIEKMKATCTSIFFFIKETDNKNNATQLHAMQRIVVLIQQGHVLVEQKDEVFNFLMSKVSVSEEHCIFFKSRFQYIWAVREHSCVLPPLVEFVNTIDFDPTRNLLYF